MKLSNNFSNETRWLFQDKQWECGECGGNGQNKGGVSLHHITGRTSSSPFNAIILCGDCHSRCGHNQEEEKKYLQKTAWYIFEQIARRNYKMTDEDKQFLETNKKYYL